MTTTDRSLTRRAFLGGAVAGATATAIAQRPQTAPSSSGSGPQILVRKRHKLRVLGTHVTLQQELRKRAEADLGIELEFSPGGSAAVLHQASTRPESFDLYEQWSNSLRVLWQSRAIQPIETNRLRYWDEINDLTKEGRLTAKAAIGAGDAPYRLLFVQGDGGLSATKTERISFLPYVHNVDSFGYDASVVPRGTPYETESWTWMLDERWAGKVAVVNAPTIGLFDLALAARGTGEFTCDDIGNLTREEVDRLFTVLMEYRRRGHFRGIWSSVPASVRLMARGEAVVESMFSPGVFDLRGKGIDCVYASPREGYRAWHGVMCLSSKTEGTAKDIAYEYMNWWLSGWPGAFIARQGYYISNPERSREELSPEEWDYWYEGKPADADLPGTHGRIVAKKGEVRDGGGYRKRFENIAVWNTVMNTYEYTLQRWNEFLTG